MHDAPLLETQLPGLLVRRGKVRDVYDLGEYLLVVSTDRISAFDWVLPTGIPDKGAVLTGLSAFWFELLREDHHLLSTRVDDFPLPGNIDRATLVGRSMLVRKCKVVPIECVVRGHLAGSGWKEYQHSQSVCGVPLPAGLVESQRLPEPIFTPATKAESGHDENISFEEMANCVGHDVADELKTRSIAVYSRAVAHANRAGIIIADTKFEWGWFRNRLILIDEVLTPDSSRFWPSQGFKAGGPQPSFDKQFVRDWLEQSGWDKNSPPPPLPADVVAKTQAKYIEAYQRLTGKFFGSEY
ncbi:MAG: phosphoribosylaminoimidazolesuccinocarboxamide synthase [Pirellulales bacterium]|nr:phosphoribosylaminoimidazolesuccinocarboxamide synthase [Pirellulales bacterium]